MTEYYDMRTDMYHDIWEGIENIKGRVLPNEIVDRWLSVKYGLAAISDEANHDGCYPFKIRNEEKFIWFKLRYS